VEELSVGETAVEVEGAATRISRLVSSLSGRKISRTARPVRQVRPVRGVSIPFITCSVIDET
jgi:hypothetical protein